MTARQIETVRSGWGNFQAECASFKQGSRHIMKGIDRRRTMPRSAGGKTPYQPAAELDPAIAVHLAAARAGDQREFSGLTEPYRHELQLHCYRILGSLQDAEDIVQETLLRAWRRLETYEG
jgi:hypothetical protein